MNQVLKIAGLFLLFVVAFVLFGYVTMKLWNWLMPILFKLPTIDFKMAMGLVILSKILFSGIRVKTEPLGQRRIWKAKWESMSDDERNEFKHDFAARCSKHFGKTEGRINKEG